MMSMQSHILKSIEKAIATAELTPVQHVEWANRGKVYAFDDAHQTILIVGYDFQDQYGSIEIRDRRNAVVQNFPCLQYHEGDRIRGLLAKINEVLAAEKAEAAYRLPQQIEDELHPDRAEYIEDESELTPCLVCGEPKPNGVRCGCI